MAGVKVVSDTRMDRICSLFSMLSLSWLLQLCFNVFMSIMLLKFLSEILYTEINCSVNARNIFYWLILQLIYLSIILKPKPVCSLKIKSFHVVLTSMLGLLSKLSESSLCTDSFYCFITFTNYPLGECRRG